MTRDQVDSWLERSILILSLLTLVAMPLVFGGRPQPATGTSIDLLLVEPFLIAQWLTFASAVLWLIRLWVDPKPRLLLPPMCWAVAAFMAYAIVRYCTADIEYVARQEVIKIVVYGLLFFIVVNNLHRQDSTQIISFSLVVLAAGLSFYAMYQYAADSDRVWHLTKPYKNRGSGTYISPNHLGGFLEMVLPLCLAYTIMGRFKPLTKIMLAYAALVILAGVGVTMSRGTWLSVAGALGVFFLVLLFYRPFRIHALIAFALLVCGLIAAGPAMNSFKARFKQMYDARGKVDDDARFALWRPAIQVWRDNPWWGAGPAHFDYRFRVHRPEEVQMKADRAHNDFLNTLADFGSFGGILIGVCWAVLVAGFLKTWARVQKVPRDIGGTVNSSKTAFVLGSAIALLAVFLHSAVDFNMHIPANALVAVTLAALLTSHVRFATESFWVTPGVALKVVASAAVIGLAGFIGFQGVKRAAEAAWLAKAARSPMYSAERTDLLKKAFEADTSNGETARLIGEAFRYRSSQSPDNYKELAEEGIQWFGRAMKLNPWDSGPPLSYGWCLDWIGRQSESWPYFNRAEELNPNSYFVMAQIGLHFVESGNLAAAKPWFERSGRLEKENNPTARNYLRIIQQRLEEDASQLEMLRTRAKGR